MGLSHPSSFFIYFVWSAGFESRGQWALNAFVSWPIMAERVFFFNISAHGDGERQGPVLI